MSLCVCSCAAGCGDAATSQASASHGEAGQGGTSTTNTATSAATHGATTSGATMSMTSANSGSNGQTAAPSQVTTGAPTSSSAGGAGGDPDAGSGGSSAGGAGGNDTEATTSGAAGAPDPGAEGVPGIIAVGYGGLRIITRDRGQTWEDEIHWSESGGDDHDLLRTIAYGKGLWVSGGWRITTSEDGVNWTDRGDAEDVIEAVNCQVTDGMAFGNGQFLVACGSTLAASSDGLSWERVGPTPDVGGHPHLVFDAATARFACSGDDGTSYVSNDGEAWTEIDIESVRLCDGLVSEDDCPSFYYDGVYLSSEWGGWIRRSTTGEDFMTTYSDQFGNNLFTEYSFAVGKVAP